MLSLYCLLEYMLTVDYNVLWFLKPRIIIFTETRDRNKPLFVKINIPEVTIVGL